MFEGWFDHMKVDAGVPYGNPKIRARHIRSHHWASSPARALA
jgi:hypothetical protein